MQRGREKRREREKEGEGERGKRDRGRDLLSTQIRGILDRASNAACEY